MIRLFWPSQGINTRNVRGSCKPQCAIHTITCLLVFPFMCAPLLYRIWMLLSYHICIHLVWFIHIRNLSKFYHDIISFMYDLHLWMRICVLYLYILLVTWNHGRTVEVNSLPYINICEIAWKQNKMNTYGVGIYGNNYQWFNLRRRLDKPPGFSGRLPW